MTVKELKKILESVSKEDENLPVILQQRGAFLQRAIRAEITVEHITNSVYSKKPPDRVFKINSNH